MAYRKRIYYTAAQKAEMRDRWRKARPFTRLPGYLIGIIRWCGASWLRRAGYAREYIPNISSYVRFTETFATVFIKQCQTVTGIGMACICRFAQPLMCSNWVNDGSIVIELQLCLWFTLHSVCH